MDYDLDTDTQFRLYQQRQLRLTKQRKTLKFLKFCFAGVLCVVAALFVLFRFAS